jgi:creatinine amidohydrolase
MSMMQSGGVRAVSRNGVLGDPTGAAAADGVALLDGLARDAAAMLGERVSAR